MKNIGVEEHKMDDEIKKEISQRLLEWRKTDEVYPYRILIHPTFRCNQRCLFCCPKREGKELSKEKWFDIVDEAKDLNVKSWMITGGGEPLVRKDVTLGIMRKIKQAKHQVHGMLTTNAALFNKKDIEEVVNMGWDEIYISLDYFEPEINDLLRGSPGAFNQVVENIKYFNKLKKERKTDKPAIRIQSVITNYTYNNLDQFVRFCHSLNCAHLSLSKLRIDEGAIKSIEGNKLVIPPENEKKFLANMKKAITVAEQLDFSFPIQFDIPLKCQTNTTFKNEKATVNLTKSQEEFLNFYCYEPFFTFVINANGKVGPCCPYSEGYKDINIKGKSLKDVWFDPKLVDLRENLKQRILSDMCHYCRDNINNDMYRELIRKFWLEKQDG